MYRLEIRRKKTNIPSNLSTSLHMIKNIIIFQQSIFSKNSIHVTFCENKQSCHVTWSTPRNSRPSLYPSLPSRNRFAGGGESMRTHEKRQWIVSKRSHPRYNILNYFLYSSIPLPISSARFLPISLYPTTLHRRRTR